MRVIINFIRLAIFAASGLFMVFDTQAQCTPAVANGAVVTCTGTEANQQGTGTEAGVTLTVGGGSAGLIDVTGTGLLPISLGNGADVIIESNGQVDGDTFAVVVQGSGSITNNGTVNFGNVVSGTGETALIVSGGGGVAAVNVTNNGSIDAVDNSQAHIGLEVDNFSFGVVNVTNTTNGVISLGDNDLGTAVTQVSLAMFVSSTGTADVTMINDGSIIINTNDTNSTSDANTQAMTFLRVSGGTMTNNGSQSIVANGTDSNVFGMVANRSSDSNLTNAGTIGVTGSASYVGLNNANESPDLVGMADIFTSGVSTIVNAEGATINLIDDSMAPNLNVFAQGLANCLDATGCANSIAINKGDINITSANASAGGELSLVGMSIASGYDSAMLNNSGNINIINNSAVEDTSITGMQLIGITNSVMENSGAVSLQDNVATSAFTAGGLIFSSSDYQFTNTSTGSIDDGC